MIVKITKHSKYFYWNSKWRKYLFKLISGKKYDRFVFDFFIHYSNIHPLDLLTIIKKYIIADTKEEVENPLSYIINERVKIKNYNYVLLKRYFWYILEWQTFFSARNTKVQKWLMKINTEDFFSDFIGFLDKSIYWNIFWNGEYFPKSKQDIETNIKTLDKFYNNLYISWYHQETINEVLLFRIRYIIVALSKNITNIEEIRKDFLILIAFTLYVKRDFVFKLDNLSLDSFFQDTTISKENIIEFINKMGVISYENYKKDVKNKTIDYYFPKNNPSNFINIQLEVHKNPFIDIWKHIKWFYFYDESFLLRKFYKNISNFCNDDSWNKWSFGQFIEKYIYTYINSWLLYKDNKLNKDNYTIDYWKKLWKAKWDWEIDLFIYNEITKNLIIFEAKDHVQLNEDLFTVWIVENLTKEKIDWRKDPWNIYKWISQLFKHSKIDKNILAEKIWVDEINNIEYVFLNHHNIMFWNEIMKHFLTKNSDFKDFKYHFINLDEFEKIVSVCCRTWKDFYEILMEKSVVTEKSYRLILERFKSYTDSGDEFKSESPNSINQDFSVFLNQNYRELTLNTHPFVDSSVFNDFFKNWN